MPHRTDLPCNVCERPHSRIYYKGRVCNACRVFFYRAISDEQSLNCLDKRQNCKVHYSQKRFCVYCRYEKCKKANMKPEAVGKKHQPTRPGMYYTWQERNEHIATIYGGMLGDKPMNVLKINGINDVVKDVKKMADYNSFIFRYGGSSPSWSSVDTAISLYDLIHSTTNCIDKTTAICDIISPDTMAPFTFAASVARATVATIEMLNILDGFRQMTMIDKAKMVQRGCLLLPTFVERYEKYRRNISDENYSEYLNRYRKTTELPEFWPVDVTYGCHRRSDELFMTLQPSEEEMVLLRLIGLYHTWPDLSESGLNQAIQTRTCLNYILEEHLVQTCPELNRREILLKIRDLLEIVNHMREICDINHSLYSNAFVQSGFTKTTLGYDLFVRLY